MLFTHLFAVAAVFGAVSADFAVVTSTTWIATSVSSDQVERASETASYVASTFLTHLSAQPEHSSYLSGLSEYVATRTDAPDPSIIMATSVETTYYTPPAWFSAMPTPLKQYWQSYHDAGQEVVVSAIKDAINGAGARPTGAVGYVGAGVAVVAGAAALL
ncbi:hypothetical protein K491DRAFT_775104 [Lophiostoma macrostomum CBS 122681]|uniref:Uncharacterized protein n=1 Tax=Lophiostoma macrostomum CBS 122681 TaxID=1314788 RepID=A0A6A6TLN4_9PLEO|nr:hypothetical protein K491DRAFT_775104 [Lophiostoma macrostomum CBS 122681]